MSTVKSRKMSVCLSAPLHNSQLYRYLPNYMYLSTSSCLVLAALLEECCYNPSMFIKFWVGRQEESKERNFRRGVRVIPPLQTYLPTATYITYLHVPLYLFMIDLTTAQGTWHNTSPSKPATLDECPFPQFSPRQ